jgi:hypothetical protein
MYFYPLHWIHVNAQLYSLSPGNVPEVPIALEPWGGSLNIVKRKSLAPAGNWTMTIKVLQLWVETVTYSARIGCNWLVKAPQSKITCCLHPTHADSNMHLNPTRSRHPVVTCPYLTVSHDCYCGNWAVCPSVGHYNMDTLHNHLGPGARTVVSLKIPPVHFCLGRQSINYRNLIKIVRAVFEEITIWYFGAHLKCPYFRN